MDVTPDLQQERQADYQSYGLSGSHRDIGRSLGERMPIVGPRSAQMSREHRAFAQTCVSVAERHHSGLVEEARGYAEGVGRPFDSVLWHFCLGVGGTNPPNCSTVGVMTPDGPVLARNYDYFFREKTRHLITTEADGALAHTGMWPALIAGRYDGVNAAGLWVSIHGGGGRPAKAVKPGLVFHHICRLLLDRCTSAQEAAETATNLPHLASYNYFVADSKNMYVVEAHPERVRVREAENGVLACTNHAVHPRMQEFETGESGENSRARLDFLLEAGRAAVGAADPGAALKAAMQDHTVPVCGHTDGLATLWSAFCAPGRRELSYSHGAPCRNPYLPANWPG